MKKKKSEPRVKNGEEARAHKGFTQDIFYKFRF